MINIRVGVVGTRGIPNRYGGFEELAEMLSVELVKKGFDLYVYNPHDHINQEKTWKGVNIIHKYSPEWLSGFAPIVYDLSCMLDCRKKKLDVVLQLGYGTSAIWSLFLPGRIKVLTNMDGLEWKRTKYNWFVRKYLKVVERIAVRRSDLLIADSPVIEKYLRRYRKEVRTIAYGAYPFEAPKTNTLELFHLRPYQYYLLIARMVQENNIELILDGFSKSKSELPFVVIGDVENSYGQYLTNKFKHHNVVFLGPLFDKTLLNNLRFYTQLYFHGHMVGGTNPSLLEAMASSALICVHGNIFNRSTIDEETTLLFKTREDIKTIIDTIEKDKNNGRLKKGLHHSDELAKPVDSTNGHSTPNEDETFSDYNKKKQHLNKLKLVINGSEHPSIQKNLNIIKSRFLWEDIVNDYADVLQQLSKS